MTNGEIRVRCLEAAIRMAEHRLAFYPSEKDRSSLNQMVEAWAEAFQAFVHYGEFHPQTPEMKAATERLIEKGVI